MANKKTTLDKQEKEILEAFENGELISSEGLEAEKVSAKKMAENTIAKTKPVNIRLSVNDLAIIQKKAKEVGLPYQTIINLLVHQYSEGKIQLII